MINRLINKALQLIGISIATIKIVFMKNNNYLDLMDDLQNCRIPPSILRNSSKGVVKNSLFLASQVIFIRTKKTTLNFTVTYSIRRVLENMSPLATSGIDIYKVDQNKFYWLGCFAPENKNQMIYNFTVTDLNKGDLICILLPSYAKISHLYVGRTYAEIDDFVGYQGEITLYGSSITQGCSSSRPGLCYANLLMTKYGYKIHNYGFSESAKGEEEIIEYISSLNSNVFVLEYDHNASEHELYKTHEKVYRKIREKNPVSTIILLSRISGGISISYEEEERRSKIIQKTLSIAINEGDKKISFIRGRDLVDNNPKLYLQDDRHPNDNGMKLIADAIYSELSKLEVN